MHPHNQTFILEYFRSHASINKTITTPISLYVRGVQTRSWIEGQCPAELAPTYLNTSLKGSLKYS